MQKAWRVSYCFYHFIREVKVSLILTLIQNNYRVSGTWNLPLWTRIQTWNTKLRKRKTLGRETQQSSEVSHQNHFLFCLQWTRKQSSALMTMLHVIKHWSHDTPLLPTEIMKVKHPIWTPWENGSKAKATSGTWRTFPIKQGRWLYQFHGVKLWSISTGHL